MVPLAVWVVPSATTCWARTVRGNVNPTAISNASAKAINRKLLRIAAPTQCCRVFLLGGRF
jgi:hypothetical protein